MTDKPKDTPYIDDSAGWTCWVPPNVEKIKFQDTIFRATNLDRVYFEGRKITEIGDKAFFFHDLLTEVEHLQDQPKLKKIGKRAFAHCPALMQIGFPEGLEEIDDGAFQGCLTLGYYSADGIDSTGFRGGRIRFPATLKRIGRDAFEGCRSLSYIHVPQNCQVEGAVALNDESEAPCEVLPSYKVHIYRVDKEGSKLFGRIIETCAYIRVIRDVE